MALKSAVFLRFILALLFLQVAGACGGGGDTPPPTPPPEDTTAPTTRANPAGGSFTAPLSVTLTCEDRGGSDCSATHFTTDGSTPTASSPAYSSPIGIAATTTLKFFSVDAKGNSEAVKSETYTFTVTDTTAPTVSASPAGGTYNAAQSVTLSCNDGSGSGCASIRFTTDGSTPTASSPAYTAPLAVSANTTLKFFATDVAGNASTVATETYVIVLDTTAPTVAASPTGGTYNSAQSVTLSCSDGTGSGCASIRYTTDGSAPTAASTQYTAALAISANTTLKFIGIDNAGNLSAVATETYVIDTVAPTVSASPTGGTYNSAQSVTLSCSDGTGSGCASIRYTTDGSAPTAASAQYTAALAISANTTLKFIGIDNAGNVSAVATETYVIDTVAPTVAANPTGGAYNSSQSVALSCSDLGGSGCASIRYTTDGSAPTATSALYTAALTLSANTTLKFIGVDNAGNVSSVATETYVIDTVAPTVTASPAGGRYTSAQSVTLNCNDGTGSGCASIRFTTDGSTPTATSTRYTAALAISANTTLKFIGIDNAGNVSSVVTETYTIDITPPTVTASPAGGAYKTPQSVTLACDDGVGTGCASIRYTTDGSAPTAASTQYTAALAISANTTLKFIGIDNAGNVSAVVTETYAIDTVAPTVAANPVSGTYNSAQSVTLSCNDGTGSGCASIRYTTDGSTPTAASTQYTAALAISANTTLKFIGIDNAGNVSSVVAETYVIDTTPPVVAANPASGTYNSVKSVTLSCSDLGGSGCASIRYTTNGSTPTASSTQYTGPISISANSTLKFIGIDNAGNVSAVATETYVIDTVAPTVAANPVSGTYNSAQSVMLSCNDGSGSGCASIRYTTDGSTPTAASTQYTAALAISADTTLKFIGIDNAGNVSAVATETYVIDTVAPTVAASPTGGTYNSAQSVTLSCNDGTGSGCASIRYTTNGSTPTATSTQYTAALSISANSTLKFIGIDNAGNVSTVATETYVIDTVAPTVAANPVSGTYNATQSVTLSCNDGTGSGCASIRYTTNGSTPTATSTQYTAALSISANTTLKFIAIDNAGNASAVVTETYVIDTVAPTVSASPAGGTYNSAQSVTLSCNDGTGSGCASIRYTTDGSTPTAASTQYTAALSISANSTLKFIGIDNAGNVSVVVTETYVIDTVAPTVAANPVSGTYNATQSVTLSCNDGTGSGCASIRYTTNGSTPTASSAQYTAALSLSTNTTLKFIGIDNAGNVSSVVTETYVIDATPPTVAASPTGGTYNSARSVTLSCNDGTGSGCASIRYTTDGSTPTAASAQYTAALSISANTTLKFIGIDNAGNVSAVATETYVIDTVAPTVAANPVSGTYNATQSVTLSCNDGTGSGCASIRYTTNGSTPTATSTQYTAALSISANTTLKFIAIDNAGNASAVVTETYVIDTVAPTVAASPTGGTYNSAQSVTLSCNDGTGSGCASIRYTINGSTPTAASTQYTAALSISANTTLKFIGIDNAGNVSSVVTETYVIDTVAPTVAASPTGGTYNSARSVTLSCNDGTGSGCASIRYTTDGSTPTASSAQYTAALSISANTTLKFIGIDNAGNVSSVATETYVIDTVAPTVAASPTGGTYNSARSVTLSCNDGTGSGCASIRYTTNGSTPTAASAQYTAALAISANTTLKFIGIDNVGNVSAVATETYVIDTVAPTVAANPTGGAYNGTRSVTLSCSDLGGSGCASIRYTTNGSTPTATSTQYTAALAISANTTLKFIGIDNAGNISAVATETYVIDTVAPTVAANPPGGTFTGSITVTLSCNDGTGSGCASIRYTTDGTIPTAASPQYTGALTFTTNTLLRFIGIDNVGNQSPVRTETYSTDATPPTTTAAPPGGTYGSPQAVTLTCNDGTGSGCAVTYYTVDGSTPNTGSPQYSGALFISANTTLKFFSVDAAGNAETVKTEQYFIGTAPSDTSTQIAAVRAAAPGTLNPPLPIQMALVTYLKPFISNSDPAGFFLQAQQNGPAIFIAVDPNTLTPVPMVGDRVSLVATVKANPVNVGGMAHVVGISTFSVDSRGESVEPLRTDVSTVDVPPVVADYESELISVSGTLLSAFASSGFGHVSSNLSTLGTPTGTNLQLRLPTTLQDQLDLALNCSVSLRGPLWRFNAAAQPSAYAASDLTLLSCPAPKVLSAVPTGATSVTVKFDRRIDPASVQANGSQFTFTNGLVATSATVQARDVLLTTVAQTSGQPYTVTVASSVHDTQGTGVDSTANTATFSGFQAPAVLRINEVSPNITGNRDLVELLVVQGGSTANFTLVQDSGTVLATLPAALVATGDIIVVHLFPDATNGDAPASETTSKSQYPVATYVANYDDAWDFQGPTQVTYSSRVLRVKDAAGNTQDGVAFARTSGTQPAGYPAELQSLQAEGQWLPANCGGAPCGTTSTPTATQVSAIWEGSGTNRTGNTVRRISAADTHMAGDWAVGAQSLGLPNP